MRERKREKQTRASKPASKFCYVHALGAPSCGKPSSSRRSLRRLFVVEVRRVGTSTSSASTSFKGYRYPVRLTQGKRQPTKKNRRHRRRACSAAGMPCDGSKPRHFYFDNYNERKGQETGNSRQRQTITTTTTTLIQRHRQPSTTSTVHEKQDTILQMQTTTKIT